MPLRDWRRIIDHLPNSLDPFYSVWIDSTLLKQLEELINKNKLDWVDFSIVRRGPEFAPDDSDEVKTSKLSYYPVVLILRLEKLDHAAWKDATKEILWVVNSAALKEALRRFSIATRDEKPETTKQLKHFESKDSIILDLLQPWMNTNTEIRYSSQLPYKNPPPMGSAISDLGGIGTLGGYLEVKVKGLASKLLVALTNNHVANRIPDSEKTPTEADKLKTWNTTIYSSNFHQYGTKENYKSTGKYLGMDLQARKSMNDKYTAAVVKLLDGPNNGWGESHKMYHGCWDAVWDEVMDGYVSTQSDPSKPDFINALGKYFGRSSLTGSGEQRKPGGGHQLHTWLPVKKSFKCAKWGVLQEVISLGTILEFDNQNRENETLAEAADNLAELRLGECTLGSGETYITLGPAEKGFTPVTPMDWAMIIIPPERLKTGFNNRRLNISKDLLDLAIKDCPDCPLARGQPLKVGELYAGDTVYKMGATTGATKGTIWTKNHENSNPDYSWYDAKTMQSKRTTVHPAVIGDYEPFKPGGESATTTDVKYWMFATRGDSGSWVVNRKAEVVGMLDSGRLDARFGPIYITDMKVILENMREKFVLWWNAKYTTLPIGAGDVEFTVAA